MRAVTAMSFQGVTFMISQPLPAAAPCDWAVVAPHRQEQSQDPVLPVLPRPRSEHRAPAVKQMVGKWWEINNNNTGTKLERRDQDVTGTEQ